MRMNPVVTITMGDPADVGPEVTVKALTWEDVWACCRPLIIGDAGVLEKAAVVGGGVWMIWKRSKSHG